MSHMITTMKALHERIPQLGAKEIVLDVRSREEYSDGHVPGSINIPHDEVGKRSVELRKYERIYVHCQAGRRAQVAFAALEKLGLSNLVCISDGGFADWAASGYEIVRGS